MSRPPAEWILHADGAGSSQRPLELSVVRVLLAIPLLAFLGAVGLFAAQNTQAIAVRFWDRSLTVPVALLAVGAYLLGMLSGWNVVAFVRRSIRRVSEESRR